MEKGILVIGSLNMDIVVEMEYMPKEGETILGKQLAYIPGGKGANQACAAVMLGAPVVMLGCVGKDGFGQRQIKNLTDFGVCMDYVNEKKNNPTGTAVIYVDKKGTNSIVVVPGANSCCDKEYLQKYDCLFHECEYVMLQMEIPVESVYYSVARAKELGKKIILNPAPAPDAMPDWVWENIDFLTPNETELMKLSGIKEYNDENIRIGARKLLAKGVKNVLVTLGEQGVLFVNKNTETIFPAKKVQAVDTTAAGDCFNGAFAAALARNYTIDEAIEFANKAAAVAVTRKGAQISIPRKEEVQQLKL